jgi:hypothetical protein
MRKKIADVGKTVVLVGRDALAAIGAIALIVWFLLPLHPWALTGSALAFAGVVYVCYRIRRAGTRTQAAAKGAGNRRSRRNAAPMNLTDVRMPGDEADVRGALYNLGYRQRDVNAVVLRAAENGPRDFENLFRRAQAELKEARA